ncbi:MAG: RpiB/LacA/LacB family sugar-phosphate isomerase [Minisyncoccia bacterium]
MLYLGADHRGYYLKEAIKKYLASRNIEFKDLGNLEYEKNDDYPDLAKKVAKAVQENPQKNRGILICGTGIGVSITANKFKNIRAGLCLSSWIAQKAREDDDINIVCLAADLTDENTAFHIVYTFLTTQFLNKTKYKRRIKKIEL